MRVIRVGVLAWAIVLAAGAQENPVKENAVPAALGGPALDTAGDATFVRETCWCADSSVSWDRPQSVVSNLVFTDRKLRERK
jgi:hypothetical protein